MKKEKLSESLQHLPDEILAETEKIRQRRRFSSPILLRIAAAAACVALIAAVGFRFLPREIGMTDPSSSRVGPADSTATSLYGGAQVPTPQTSDSGEAAPQPNEQGPCERFTLTLTEQAGSMGFEGYMAYDISELVSGNPWTTETRLDTLPVYRNTTKYDKPLDVDFGGLETFLWDIASRLGIDKADLTVETNEPDAEQKKKITEKFARVGETVPEGYFDPSCLYGKSETFEIMVQPGMSARIKWDPPFALPNRYDFSWTASLSDKEKSAEYLLEQFSALIDMIDPVLSITGGDYLLPSDGQNAPYPQYQVNFFDGSGDTVEDILNFNFNYLYFSGDEQSDLWLAWVYQQDLSDLIGDFPVITWQQAQEMLGEGKYFTTAPEAMPGEEYVKKVDLVYRKGIEFLIPYYRFYVEMPSWEQDNGLKTYGAYYVPAIAEEYLRDPPWGGWLC